MKYVKSGNRIIVILNLIFVFLLNGYQVSAAEKTAKAAEMEALREKDNLENYIVPPAGGIADRIFSLPLGLQKYFNEYDKDFIKPGAPYKPYFPTDSEMVIIRQAIGSLPNAYDRVISPKVLGIYFIENFASSGYAERIDDGKGGFYYFLTFNSNVLKLSASEWITEKEKTCFILDDPSYDIEIDIGNGISGFDYILLHEMTHLLDYIRGVTPGEMEDNKAVSYVEMKNKKILPSGAYPFVSNVWDLYYQPEGRHDFLLRKDITFYGFSNGPRLKISDSVKVYRELRKTPFVSLYGAKNWMEDFAEFMAMYVHVKKRGEPWKLRVTKDGKTVYEMKNILDRINFAERVKMAEKYLEVNNE